MIPRPHLRHAYFLSVAGGGGYKQTILKNEDMLKGKIPTDPQLKKFRGSYRADRMKQGQITGEPITQVPDPPAWLDDPAKVIFREAATLIMAQKKLFASDLNLIAIYSFELWVYQTAVEKLKDPASHVMTTATGYEQVAPWVSIRNQAAKNVRDIGQLYGLDPVSRAKLGIRERQEPDEFEKLFYSKT
ncbi:MAG TPA: P27 family phage terminase small subunit [Prolixibacteraceae bacterium]|nr:P27 family phage terminase small subunit [Prolixibacteraceae bacterium]HNZ69512.1 P27 family phage terminase small subunit [Prolixibacteraceae bacterium]